MIFKTSQYLSEKERKILGFLSEEEHRRRNKLLEELKILEETALQRFQTYLRDNADTELTRLAEQTAADEDGARDNFAEAVRKKLLVMTAEYGKFAFAVWDWEWNLDYYKDITVKWNKVFNYEAKTVCDFHCTVLSDRQQSPEWAQDVFDNFFTIKHLKETLGIPNNNNEAVDRVIHQVGRELIPVKYEK